MASGSESFAVAWSLNHGWLWPHGLQHTRLLCPSLSPGVCSNSCPLNQWCYLIISSSATPFSFSIQSFPASGSLPMSQLFTSSGQTIGASASAPVLRLNIQGGFPLGLIGWISLQSNELSRVLSSTTVWKLQFFSTQPFLWSNSHIHIWLLKKTIALTIWTFVGKVMSLLFNVLFRFDITFLPKSKHLKFHSFSHHLQWFWSPRKENLSLLLHFPVLFSTKWWDQMPWSSFSECWALSQVFVLLFLFHHETF